MRPEGCKKRWLIKETVKKVVWSVYRRIGSTLTAARCVQVPDLINAKIADRKDIRKGDVCSSARSCQKVKYSARTEVYEHQSALRRHVFWPTSSPTLALARPRSCIFCLGTHSHRSWRKGVFALFKASMNFSLIYLSSSPTGVTTSNQILRNSRP